MIHFMKLNPEPYKLIMNCSKTIELRLYDEKRQRINVGDHIVFSNLLNPKENIKTEVINLYIFKSFADLYAKLPLEKCGYSSSELEKASPDDMLKYYTTEEQGKYGVVGIEIKLL